MTEKPEPFLKTNGTEKKLLGSPLKADSCLNIKDISNKVGNSSVPYLDLENNNDGRSNFRTPHSVTIKNVPSTIDLLELKEAISVFGKVSKASKRAFPNGFDSCDIEFKHVKSSKKALSMGYIIVACYTLKICVEDLQHLHSCVLHLENHPLNADTSFPPSTESEL